MAGDLTLNEALKALVRKLGGSGVIGPKLFPEKTGDGAAQRFLIDCLSDDRPARLSPEHLLLLLRMARDRGVHDGAEYLMREMGYAAPQPIDPVDELADLQRKFIESVRTQADLSRAQAKAIERMEKLLAPRAVSRVA